MSINTIEYTKQNILEVQNSRDDLVILTGEEAKLLDSHIVASGISGFSLMQRAASASVDAILLRWPHAKKYSIFCGTGNNAGDGITLAVMLKRLGKKVSCVLVAGNNYHNEAKQAYDLALREQVNFLDLDNWQQSDGVDGEEVLIDAIFGIGLNRNPVGVYQRAIEMINKSRWQVCALDIPSGINSSTGEKYAPCIKAELTLAFLALKFGLVNADSRENIGRLYLSDLGVEVQKYLSNTKNYTYLPGKDSLKIPARSPLAHKGDHGKLLIIGGFSGTNGAIGLTAAAALRSGAGMVKVLTIQENNAWLLARNPELMISNATDKSSVLDLLAWCDALVIGNGLGQTTWSRELWNAIRTNYTGKCVIDADALNLWSTGLTPTSQLRQNCCITPHPKEASRLLNTSVEAVQNSRSLTCEKLAQLSDCGILKGANSLVFNRHKKYFCSFGNAGMASAGTGDILAGIVGGLLAQGLSLEKASLLACIAHAKAGDTAAKTIGIRGMLASDLLNFIPRELN